MSAEEAAVAAFLRLRLKVARVTGRNARTRGSLRSDPTLNETKTGAQMLAEARSAGRQRKKTAGSARPYDAPSGG